MNTKDEPPIREAGVMNADVTSNVTTKDPAEYWAARWRIMATEVNTLDIENRKLRAEVEKWRDLVKTLEAEKANRPWLQVSGSPWDRMIHERDELHVEVERLKAAVVEVGTAHLAAHAEAEQLRADLKLSQEFSRAEIQKRDDEIERLKETITEWQQIHGTFAASGAPDDVHFACRAEIERLQVRVKELETGIRKFLDPTGPEAFGLERAAVDYFDSEAADNA